MVGANLLRYDKDQKWCCFDSETSSLNLQFTLPFQVAFVTFTLDKILEKHNYYVWWDDFTISKKAAFITRFNEQEYRAKARPAKEILDIVESYLYNPEYKIAAQNFLGYDSMIINAWRRKLGLKPTYEYLYNTPFKVYDTIALSKAVKKGIKPDLSSSNNFLAWQYRMLEYKEKGLKTSLGTVAKEENIAVNEENLHEALTDVIVNVEIHKKRLWQIEI